MIHNMLEWTWADGNARLVNGSPSLIPRYAIVGQSGKDAFVPFWIARDNRQGLDTTNCVIITTTGIALPIALRRPKILVNGSTMKVQHPANKAPLPPPL